MPSNAELEIAVRKLTAEVVGLKEVLNQIFSHPDLSMELRKIWNAFTHQPVESTFSEPKPLPKGEAQKHLDYIQSFQEIFERNKENQNVNSNSNAAR